ncbi:MAG: murein transglycosylase A [Francisellaceae bacterium]
MQKKYLITGIIGLLSGLFSHTVYASIEYKEVDFNDLPGWSCSDQLYAYKALISSCNRIINDNSYTQGWIKSCKLILSTRATTSKKARQIFKRLFIPYQVIDNGRDHGLFTGYFEPGINGSLHKTSYYQVPIFGTPPDLVIQNDKNSTKIYGRMTGNTLIPYYSRREINQIKDFNAPTLAWVHSKAARTFMQIQGSGRIILNNGQSILLGYDSQNGQPYRPIGRYFLEKNLISRENLSMQSIKKWLLEHPLQQDSILSYDPSFVFFKVLKGLHPFGAEGVALTPGYSLAIDKNFHQYGTPVWLDTSYDTPTQRNKPLRRLLIAQDTGGAIRGAIRGDVFWGSGKMAEYYAGHMKQEGKMYILLPKIRS